MKPEWCPQWAWEKTAEITGTWTVYDHMRGNIARALLEAHQRGRREGMEEAAKVAEEWLENEAHDLSDVRDGYIEARKSGRYEGRKISDDQARSFASEFRHRSDAVHICADYVSAAIRAKAQEVKT